MKLCKDVEDFENKIYTKKIFFLFKEISFNF